MKTKPDNGGHGIQNNRVKALFDISCILNAPRNPDQIFESVYTRLNHALELPEFYVALYHDKTDSITLPFVVSQKQRFYDCTDQFSYTHPFTKKVLAAEKTVILNTHQIETVDGFDPQKYPAHKIYIGIPLASPQKKHGVLAVAHFDDPDYFTPETIEFLNAAANQICLALEKNQYADEVDRVQNHLLNIINSMPSILIVLDKHGMITQWNVQTELETRIRAEDAIGQPLEKVFPRSSIYLGLINESLKFNRIKTRLRQPYTLENETRFEDVIIYPLITKKESGVVIRMDDITDQVRLEEMMIQSEKMLSIGGLAAGMAHEINNPLAGMMQTAQVIYNRLHNDVPANETAAAQAGITLKDIRTYAEKRQIFQKLDQINETGTRAAQIVRNMLGFARKSDGIFENHHLPDILRKTLTLIKNDYNLNEGYNFKLIDIVEDFDESIPPVLCDKSKLQQVFFNLLKNGAEAMFDVTDETFKPRFVLRIYTKENKACLEFENNGPSISKEEQQRLFEPFFTTKPIGSGTGLGLSLSYFIITNDHKGEMTVESSPGIHTRFIIRLPFG
ncbi:MAG: GAF domain-containing protein [Proteobacteria bacterium]|nr:GAF domain-containing protein [Pseudomonadota bacterium]MBU1387420.1 GAF domain-containing protein [Pseudomonadota bacterium]MBU2429723.1 GAF domain-containing protein [Pseudomonadota bacterium]MBU2481992.1 GAF domain-containing protein [Pseudomonadota bacterium]